MSLLDDDVVVLNLALDRELWDKLRVQAKYVGHSITTLIMLTLDELADRKPPDDVVEIGEGDITFRVTLDVLREIDACLDASRLIPAIKVLRTATGCGLRDAKFAVEAYRRTRP